MIPCTEHSFRPGARRLKISLNPRMENFLFHYLLLDIARPAYLPERSESKHCPTRPAPPLRQVIYGRFSISFYEGN